MGKWSSCLHLVPVAVEKEQHSNDLHSSKGTEIMRLNAHMVHDVTSMSIYHLNVNKYVQYEVLDRSESSIRLLLAIQ